MKVEEIQKILVEELGSDKVVAANLDALDPWIEVAVDAILDVVSTLKTDERFQFDHLNNLCGVDYLEPDPKKAKKFTHEPHLEVVYHLSSIKLKHRLTLKVKLPRWKDDREGELPEISTVSEIWPIADWHEREAYDLFGIRFVNHPNLRRILCPEDWVGYPLRKDYEFPLEYHGIRGK